MRNIWFTSDTHFRHAKVITFLDSAGHRTRPFDSIEQHDECLMDHYNECVKEGDRVYHLGDVICKHGVKQDEVDAILSRLHGSKRLLVGNHDTDTLKLMVPHFKKIGLWRIFDEHGFVASHLPLMESQFRHGVGVNVHGHTHQNLVQGPYINVCVERTFWKPVHLDEILDCMRRNFAAPPVLVQDLLHGRDDGILGG